MQKNLDEFTARGVHVLAVSVDPPEVTRRHAEKQGYTLHFLSDPKARVIRRYDLLHEGGGPKQADISRPAEFLLDPGGAIRWTNLTADFRVRLRAQEILKALDRLRAAARSDRRGSEP